MTKITIVSATNPILDYWADCWTACSAAAILGLGEDYVQSVFDQADADAAASCLANPFELVL